MGSLCVILSAILFGMMPLLTKITYTFGCNAYMAAAGRFLFGAIGIFFIIPIVPTVSFRISVSDCLHIFLLSIPFSITTLLLYGSYHSIGSGLATTLHFTYPVIVMVLHTLVFHTKIQVRQLICLFICTAGILCLYRPDNHEGTLGIIMALLSGFTYSIYILCLAKREHNHLPVLTITLWLSIFSFIEIGIFSAANGNFIISNHWQVWAAMIGLGLSASIMALSLFQIGVMLCGEVKASLLSTFEPLTGIVIGILAFHEHLTSLVFIGILLILISTILLVLSPEQKK